MSFKELYEFLQVNRYKRLTEIKAELIDLIDSYAQQLANDRGGQQYAIGFKSGVVTIQEHIKKQFIKHEKDG